jgi:translation initiation factor IF-3
VREVRVIGANSEQLGVMSPEDALIKAREAGLDLVEVAATSRPPVCRIMDYGRYKYEQKKKKKSNKGAHAASLKEIKLRPGTDMHDLEFKLNNARKFLMEGDKVKVTVMFRGREMVHVNRGRAKLMQVREMLGTLAKMENPPRMEGRFMSMILIADREVVAEAKRLEELESAESDSGASEEVVDRKAERRAAKQRKADEAQASEQHPEQQLEEHPDEQADDESKPAAPVAEKAGQAEAAASEEGAS